MATTTHADLVSRSTGSIGRKSLLPDQRFVIHGVRWQDYVVVRAALDVPGLRMAYMEGALELMSPSSEHEDKKKTAARLVEVHALERGLVLYGYGNATFRKEAAERGAEPDECWVVGRKLENVPDIALEIVMASGGIDKLHLYAGLGVREVWFYENDAFHIHELTTDGYREVNQSALVPDIDFGVLARHLQMDDQHEAVLAYRDWLQTSENSPNR